MGRREAFLAVGLFSCAAACGSPGPMTLDGVTIMRHGPTNVGPAALYTGPVALKDGCVAQGAGLDADLIPIIWPPTAGLSHQADAVVVLVDGLVVHDGDVVSIGGGEIDAAFAEELSGPIPAACRADLYWLAGEVSQP
jgi:hypothetical protein